MVETIMSDLQRNIINYMVVCVNDYADRHGLSYAETFDYLLRNKGLDFLEDCYDAEHTLSLDTALDDLDAICLMPSANAMKDLWHEVVPRFKHGVS